MYLSTIYLNQVALLGCCICDYYNIIISIFECQYFLDLLSLFIIIPYHVPLPILNKLLFFHIFTTSTNNVATVKNITIY